jgi:hypothetical protein
MGLRKIHPDGVQAFFRESSPDVPCHDPGGESEESEGWMATPKVTVQNRRIFRSEDGGATCGDCEAPGGRSRGAGWLPRHRHPGLGTALLLLTAPPLPPDSGPSAQRFAAPQFPDLLLPLMAVGCLIVATTVDDYCCHYWLMTVVASTLLPHSVFKRIPTCHSTH